MWSDLGFDSCLIHIAGWGGGGGGVGVVFFFFNDTATTEIYTLSLHDALPICSVQFFVSEWLPILVLVSHTVP